MRFNRYNKIRNSYDNKLIGFYQMAGMTSGTWHAQEKIHGANAQIAVRLLPKGEYHIQFGKRSSFIGGMANFHNHDKVLETNKEKVIKLYNLINKDNKSGTNPVVRIYGEIFGGEYPHPDVPKVQGHSRVQKGVFYCPENRFIAFDIMVNDDFLDVDDYLALCQQVDLLHCKTLFSGTFAEMLELNEEFQSTLPADFGLPPLEDNLAEGFVLKPNKTKFMSDGKRVILKKKSKAFSEVSSKKKPTIKVDDPKVQEAFAIVLQYINENRLRNVLSHIGPVSKRDFGKILKAFNLDILQDLEEDHEGLLEGLEDGQAKAVRKLLNQTSANLLRLNINAIVEGYF